MLADENKGNIICLTPLTSLDVMVHNPSRMEQQSNTGRVKRPNYPLRFRSKAQKKRLEEAAKRVHKTLKDFLIDLGEKAAAEMQGELKAS